MKVVAPAESSSKSNGDVIVIDEDSESEDEKRLAGFLVLGRSDRLIDSIPLRCLLCCGLALFSFFYK